jgi:endonuclease IV
MKEKKYGIKLYSTNHELYSNFIELYHKKRVDFLELLYMPGKEEEVNQLIKNDIPIIIHAPTLSQGVAFASDNFNKNRKIIEKISNFADRVNAESIIIHPDVGNKDNFINFLKMNKDRKIMIENMPKKALNNNVCLGYTKKEINEFVNIGNFELCLDFTHAIKSAISQNLDYKIEIKDFASLKPKLFHLCDATLKTEVDEHLNLGEGEFDLRFIKNIIQESDCKKITFEVPKLNGLDNDIKNIEYFKKL